MNSRFPWRLVGLLGALIIPLASTHGAYACAVCFGDPESPMAKGAVAGVMVLVGVVGFVLLAVAGTGLFWIQRGRRFARMEQTQPHHDS